MKYPGCRAANLSTACYHYLGTLPGRGGSSGQPQRGQRVEPRQSRSTSMRRTAGRVGWGGGPGEPASLFPPRPEPQMLEERERDHGHQRVPVQTGPGAALEMVEAELLLHLLVRLLAHPARLDRGPQLLERGLRGQVGEVVLPLARGAMLAD